MKKLMAYLMAIIMLLSIGANAFATNTDAVMQTETAEATEGAEGEEVPEIEPDPAVVKELGYSAARAIAYGVNPEDIIFYDNIVVANTTPMRGDFFTELWTNSTSDIDVRNLLHGYNLVRWDGENGAFRADPTVVTGMVGTENIQSGDRTYTMVLANDLYYSDGSRITAWDYAFSFLLRLSPAIQEIGGAASNGSAILGADDYSNGDSNVLAGVHVTADDVLAVTLNGDYLPFFFELGLLSCNPYPISVIAPGCEVRDDGNGVYIRGNFNAALINSTVNGADGYRINPSVVSGPYKLTSFDGVTAEFERNDYYKGNADQEMPLIPTLTYTLANNQDMEEKLISGEYDVLNKVTKAEVITDSMSKIPDGEIAMSNYPRSGLAYVAFCCERATVASEAVRQALAWCMDRDAIVADYTGNFGLRTDSYFGVGQWMYSLINGTVAPPVDPPEDENDPKAMEEYEAELEAWAELNMDNLTTYEVNVEEAKHILEADGWQLNAEGVREKAINGIPVALDLTILVPKGNSIAESFEANWIPYLEEAGIRLTIEAADPAEITKTAYERDERTADMFFMATNFDIVFDPATSFEVNGVRSVTRQADRELYELAVDMRQTEPGEVLEYMQKWVEFEQRFNEVLPMIPVYSNVYFDFYTSRLHDYDIPENVSWSNAILGAVKADIPEYEVEATTEEQIEIEAADEG